MTYSRSRRRKRNNTETTQDDASLAETSTDISASLKDIAPGDSDIDSTQEEELTEEETRKLEIWETFREEYFEAVEQLPLSLHRSFALMKELDEHSQSFQLNLLPLIHKYVEQRRAFIPRTEHQVQDEPLDVSMNDSVVKLEDMEAGGSESGAINGQVYEPTKDAMEVSDSSSIPSVPSFQIMPQNAQSTQEILSRIAWLTSELVRTSDEKVNLAQAAYNSVDRHVRLLDHAIIEQESCMTLGMQPGTKPSSIVEAEGMVTNDYSVAHQTVDMDISNLKSARARKSSRTRGQENQLPKLNERKSEPPISITLNLLTPKERNVSPNGAKLSTSKRSALSQDMPIDPHEPRYCYCNQVSYGEMIACDNEDCEREWFHLACCGFTEAPKGKWFCKDCHEKGVVNTTRKKGH